jgi:FkbM family methyltransferase
MKFSFFTVLMRAVRLIVVKLEIFFNINISRFPLEKYYGDFIDQANLDLVSQSRGVLHIGAHLGQESEDYAIRGKPVIWVEADPLTFLELNENLSKHKNQYAFNIVLGDEKREIDFFRASNGKASSSVFSFSKENSFKNVTTSEVLRLTMSRLDANFTADELGGFDHWVIDVQGAELLVLKGAGQLLSICRTLFVECSKSEYYNGGVQWNELQNYLKDEGFRYFTLPKNLTHMNVIFFRFMEK